MEREKTIVYVNFFPYDNAGNILTYLQNTFETVIHFSFDPQQLNKNRSQDILVVYKQKKEIFTKNLLKPPISIESSQFLLFFSMPFSLLFMAVHILFNVFFLKKKFGVFNFYLSANGYTTVLGIIAKRLLLVQKTIFWVWDYFPPQHPDWKVRLARTIYWKFDLFSTKASDKVCFLNKRLETLRKQAGIIKKNNLSSLVPIGTDPIPKISKKNECIIGHFGVLKKTQGLEYLFENLETLQKRIPDLKVEIIGTGSDEDFFRKKSKPFSQLITFHGYIQDEKQLSRIVRRWSAGLALYQPSDDNVSPWTDPSKVKYYLNFGIPVIISNVIDFALEIKKYNAGIVIPYGDNQALLNALTMIISNQEYYQKNALQLAQRYYYKKLYAKLFI